MANPFAHLSPDHAESILAAIMGAPRYDEVLARIENPPPPAPWVVPVLPEAASAFQLRLASCQPKRREDKSVKGDLFKAWGGRCAYCGAGLHHPEDATPSSDLRRPVADWLVTRFGGGMPLGERVLACSDCSSAKGQRDWLLWGKARSPAMRKQLRALRLTAARSAMNHFAQDPVKVRTAHTLGRMLDNRWSHPRFRVYSAITTGGAYIGWQTAWPIPGDAHAICKHFRGQPLAGGPRGLVGYAWDQPEQAIAAIWTLIDNNAWCISLDMESEGFPDSPPLDARPWKPFTPNFRDLVKRRLATERRKGHGRRMRDA